MSWQDQWEADADDERAAFLAMSMDDLLEAVRLGRYGLYHQIWDVIAQRADLAQAGWVLFDVLERDIDYLHRMPCAEALLILMGDDRYEPVDLAGTHDEVAANVQDLKAVLTARIGSRPS
jgi:hypothetical protein